MMMMKMKVMMMKDRDTGYHSCGDTYDREEIKVTRARAGKARAAGKRVAAGSSACEVLLAW